MELKHLSVRTTDINSFSDMKTELKNIHYDALLRTLTIVFAHDKEGIELEKITIDLVRGTIETDKL